MLKTKEVTDMFDYDQIRLISTLSKVNVIAIADRHSATMISTGLHLTVTLPPVPHQDAPSVTHQDANCCASPGQLSYYSLI